ncbi:hypothetical protein FQA47_011846 [Oryzias melastigma]|uniref:Uncharacterized protein n=1 Tax=Oryzias melastigma TaxID=30732 RepID=A0A834FDC0_ORYME|nr:hypothetical protein FQA47_011846 [Oryzias melastigma]
MTGRKLSSSSLVGDAGNTQRRVGRDSAAALTSAPEKVCRHYREEPKGFGYNERSWSVNSKNLQVTVRYGFTRLRILPKSMINVSDRNSTPQCPGGSPVGQFFCQKQM